MDHAPSLINRRNCLLTLFCLWISGFILPIAAKKRYLSTAHEHLFLQYEKAKALYQGKEYCAAKALLDTLKKEPSHTPLAPYIYFYYALAAYHNGEVCLARQTFARIHADFPFWNKQNEVLYWWAQCAFQAGNLEEALRSLHAMQAQNKTTLRQVSQMKKYFLKQMDDLTYLEQLIEKFPEDAMLKKVLYKKAARCAYITQDYTLVETLKQRYHLPPLIYNPLARLSSQRKESYRVALFLPFFVDELEDAPPTSNEFIIELYQGIRLALEKLTQAGITLQLFTFDTKNSEAVTKTLLTQPSLQNMDLIIGPLYQATIPPVASFAKKHKINFLNPISTNAKIIQGNPFAFLFQSSLETQAQKAAELTINDLKLTENPRIAVFYSALEDELQAASYKQIVEQACGKPLDIYKQFIKPEDSKLFFDQVIKQRSPTAIACDTDAIDHEIFNKITHIYLPTQNKILVSSVISFCLRSDIQPKIIGNEQWLKDEILTMHLGKLPILLLSPHYIDFKRPSVKEFRATFFEQTGTLPTIYSYQGYEMMYFFGHMLASYGTYFQKEWENVTYDGILFQKIFYGKNHCNQYIPILKFNKDRFVLLNP